MNLDAVRDFKVLVLGDAILDRYVFVSPTGKSIKETALSTSYQHDEQYHGGVWAAAEHLDELCATVHVWHGPNIMRSTRFVEGVYNRKLFTLHGIHAAEQLPPIDIGAYDVVIVTDFGYGTLTDALIARLTKEARFLAVNAQTNSQNYGFNMVTRYRRADYVVLDELEARLATHMKSEPIEDVILALGFRKIVVTMGANGACGFDGEFYREAATLKGRVVDTMGAGDAFLAVSAVYAAALFPMRHLVRLGNAAGAAKVGVLGHQRAITRADLEANLA